MLKRFLVIFFPFFLFITVIFSYTYYEDKNDYLNLLQAKENADFNKLQKKTVANNFKHVVADLLYLSEEHELLALLDGTENSTPEDLAKDYLSFSLQQQLYDQIRFLNEKGQEIIRVDFKNGTPVLTPKEKLQNKSSRYYFQETIALDKGDIFVSPMDLNMEQGKVEVPHKPMIRFGTPVFDSSGKKRGTIILNFFGEILLNNIRITSESSDREVSLLNSDGYWMMTPHEENAWGFMFKDKKNQKIDKIYPKIWQQVYAKQNGQFLSHEGLITFATVYPLNEIKTYFNGVNSNQHKVTSLNKEEFYWKIIYRVPHSVIDEHNAQRLQRYFCVYLIFILLSSFGCYYFSRLSIRRKKTEHALRQSELNLSKAQEIAHVGSWEWDIENDRIIWSDETYRIFGIQDKEISPTLKMIEQAISLNEREEHRRNVEKAVKETGLFEMEYTLTRPDKTKRVVFARGEAMRDNAGKTVKLIGMVQDITERNKFEEALKKAHIKLEERVKIRTAELATLNKDLGKKVEEEISVRRKQEQFMIQQSKMAAMGEMVASIAHQWRQPLNGLGLLIQDINDAYEYDELDEKYIKDTVTKSMGLIQFMSGTIDDFRNFFKPSKEKIFFIIDSAIQDVLVLLSSQLIHHEIKIRIFCDELELKGTLLDKNDCCDNEESGILGYPNEFKQVLINIMNNAREAINEKTANKNDERDNEICIRRSITKDSVIIDIEDNAGGIEPKVLERVFEPYFTTKEEGKGTGIGLYMSKVIIEQNMGGTLTVKNSEKGAVFTITLKKEVQKKESQT